MLSTANEKIVNFYKNHPSISFEQSNLLLIELLEKMTIENISSSMVSQMTDRLKSMEDHIQRQEGTLSLKLMEMKDKYMEDIKMVLSNNVSERMTPLLQNYNQQLLDKTTLLLQTLPDKIRELQTFIEANKTNPSIDLSQIEKRFEQTQREIDIGFKQITDISTKNQRSVTDLLGKMTNSTHKGKISENLIFTVLETLFSSADIDFVGTTKETGDFIVNRRNKPKVLVENKDYARSVPTDEVNKFIRDIDAQKCCGIFISNSGICGKEPYEVQVHNGHVLVYIQFCNYDLDKVKTGFDIIDHFKEMLDKLDEGMDTDTISKVVIKEINDEYKVWISNRTAMLKNIKDFHDTMKKQLESMAIPNLEMYMSKHFTPLSAMLTCEHCGFNCKNKQSLSAHLRGCPKLKK